MFSVGDIVHFYSAVAGKAKYHLCFCYNDENGVYSFVFLNSEGEYEDHFSCECSRIPNMPPSRSGLTVFSCPTVIRKRAEQLDSLDAKKITSLPPDVASDVLKFAVGIKSMTQKDKENFIVAMEAISGEVRYS